MELMFLFLLILLNGVFAMSEIAIVAARKLRLQSMAEAGDRTARVALDLHNDPNNFLSTVQVGITSIGILNGILGQEALAVPFAVWLQDFGMSEDASEAVAITAVVLGITYLSIVIGELVPKRIAQLRPEGIAQGVAPAMLLLSIVARPFVLLLATSTELLLRLLRIRRGGPDLTEEDIQALVEQGSRTGVIHHQEPQLVRNVFRLDDRQVQSLMTHRKDITWLDVQNPLEENLRILRESSHSLFPVCNGGLHNILGIISGKDLLLQFEGEEDINLSLCIRSAVFLPETLSGMDLLNHFSTSRSKLALVVDEYGEVQGLVTAQDVLKTLVGEITSAEIIEKATSEGEGRWLLDGLLPLPELKDILDWKTVPDEERGGYHTLGGLVMQLLGHLPTRGDRVQWEGWELSIIALDGKRVSKVRAVRLPEPEADDEAEA